MNERSVSRRGVIRAGVFGSAMGLAGCLDAADRVPVDVPADVPVIGGPGYTDWLPEPRVLGTDHYQVAYLDVADVDDNRHEFDRNLFDDIRSVDEFLPGVEFEDLDELVIGEATMVASGDHDVGSVADELRDDGYRFETEYEGYEIYSLENVRAVGVGEDHLIVGAGVGDRSARTYVEIVIDTERGEEQRYHEVDADFEAITDALGGGTLHMVETYPREDETEPERGRFRNNVGTGVGWDVDGPTTDLDVVLAFRDEGDVHAGDVEEWLAAESLFEYAYDLDVDEDGSLATVSGTIDTRDLEEMPS